MKFINREKKIGRIKSQEIHPDVYPDVYDERANHDNGATFNMYIELK